MIASNRTIHKLCKRKVDPLISPYSPKSERKNWGEYSLSGGLSYAGYDIHLSKNKDVYLTKVLTNRPEYMDGIIVVEPGEFLLVHSLEHFCIPRNMISMVKDKSSIIRRGLAVQNTVAEPGWKGYLTLELTNHSKDYITLYLGQPIAQLLFEYLDDAVDPYVGSYQDQPDKPVKPRQLTMDV